MKCTVPSQVITTDLLVSTAPIGIPFLIQGKENQGPFMKILWGADVSPLPYLLNLRSGTFIRIFTIDTLQEKVSRLFKNHELICRE